MAPLIVATGHLEVDFKEIDIQYGNEFVNTKLHDGRFVPGVKPRDIKVKINRSNIKIHLHGNLISDIADLFTWFVKGTLSNTIEDTVFGILHDNIPKATNNFIAKTDGYLSLPKSESWMIDWETADKAYVHDKWVGLGFKGLFINQVPEVPAGAINSTMPLHDNKD